MERRLDAMSAPAALKRFSSYETEPFKLGAEPLFFRFEWLGLITG